MKLCRLDNPLPLGLLLGVVSGAIIGVSGYVDVGADAPSRLEDILSGVGEALTLLVSPAIVSLIARRNYFWWGFVPAITGVVVALAADYARPAMIHYMGFDESVKLLANSLPSIASVTAMAVSISSGPVSLVRYVIERRRRLAAEGEEAARLSVENGKWPPAPRR